MFGHRKPVADLTPNEQVLLDMGGDRASDLVPSRVVSADTHRVRLEAPRRAEDAVLFRPGVAITVRYLRGNEMGLFRTTIEDLETGAGGRRVLVAPQPDKIRWTQDIPEPQKRQFTRLDVEMPVVLLLGDESREAVAIELSGGGMIVELAEALPEGGTVHLEFSVGEDFVTTDAHIVRSRPGPTDKTWHVALHFVRMDSNDEDLIARFILDTQAAERRRSRS